MKFSFQLMGLSLVALATTAFAQTAPTKVGIINIQGAIVGTQDGQKAIKALEEKSAPRRKDLETKQAAIQQLQTQLRTSSNTASEEMKAKLMRDVDTRTKSYNRDLEDAQAEFDQEQQKLLNEIGGRIMAVIDKYASENGYAIILDVSTQQSPVLYASNSIEITREVVALYDKNGPAGNAVKPAVGGAAPSAVRPSAPPAQKKATPPAK